MDTNRLHLTLITTAIALLTAIGLIAPSAHSVGAAPHPAGAASSLRPVSVISAAARVRAQQAATLAALVGAIGVTAPAALAALPASVVSHRCVIPASVHSMPNGLVWHVVRRYATFSDIAGVRVGGMGRVPVRGTITVPPRSGIQVLNLHSTVPVIRRIERDRAILASRGNRLLWLAFLPPETVTVPVVFYAIPCSR